MTTTRTDTNAQFHVGDTVRVGYSMNAYRIAWMKDVKSKGRDTTVCKLKPLIDGRYVFASTEQISRYI